jgi:hypothetical protein
VEKHRNCGDFPQHYRKIFKREINALPALGTSINNGSGVFPKNTLIVGGTPRFSRAVEYPSQTRM